MGEVALSCMCDIKSAHLGNRMYDEVICTIKRPLGLRAIPSVSEETIFWTCMYLSFIHFILDNGRADRGVGHILYASNRFRARGEM